MITTLIILSHSYLCAIGFGRNTEVTSVIFSVNEKQNMAGPNYATGRVPGFQFWISQSNFGLTF